MQKSWVTPHFFILWIQRAKLFWNNLKWVCIVVRHRFWRSFRVCLWTLLIFSPAFDHFFEECVFCLLSHWTLTCGSVQCVLPFREETGQKSHLQQMNRDDHLLSFQNRKKSQLIYLLFTEALSEMVSTEVWLSSSVFALCSVFLFMFACFSKLLHLFLVFWLWMNK